MQVLVETYFEDGVEKLRRFHLDSRQIEIAENIDQWHGADYRYFKVRGRDGNLCGHRAFAATSMRGS